MKHPTTNLLVYLFPLLAPTLAFAHARPHPHPHARAAGTDELSEVQKLKRQLPVLNDTIIPIESQTTSVSSSSSSSSSFSASSEEPTATRSRPGPIDLDEIISQIEDGVLGPSTTEPTTESTSASEPTSTRSSDVDSSTTESPVSVSSTEVSETADDLPTVIPSATITSGVTTGLNTPTLTVQPPIPIETDEPTSSETTTSAGLLDPIIDVIDTLLPEPTTTTTAETTEPTVESTTEAPSPSPTGLDDILSSILEPIGDPVTSLVDSVTSLLPNATEVISSVTDATEVPTVVPTVDTTIDPTIDPTIVPTIEPTVDTTVEPTIEPTAEPTVEPTVTDTTVEPTVVPTAEPTIIPTDTGIIIPTDTPANTTEPTGPITEAPSETAVTLPPAETSLSDIPTDSAAPTLEPTVGVNSTALAPSETSSAQLPIETSDAAADEIPTDSVSIPSQTVTDAPTATESDVSSQETSSLWFGTSLVTQAPPTAVESDTPVATETSLPSGVPEAITPPGGVPNEPLDSVLIQVGFNESYNYAFVSSSLESAAQICDFLPKGLAFGLDLSRQNISMHTLQPFQPEGRTYIITLGLVYIPKISFEKLKADILIAVSPLYTNPDITINRFMDFVDPTIPLLPGSNIALLPPSNSDETGTKDPSWMGDADDLVNSSEDSGTPGDGSENDADPFGSDGGSRNEITSKQVTIVGASVGAAALYGIAMYFLAKRYRNNRLSHRRSQSLSGGGIEPPSMSDLRSSGQLSPMMSQHFFHNGRTTPTGSGSDKRGSKGSKTSARGQISAPMMSENSLGWD